MAVLAIALTFTSFVLIKALRKEKERHFRPFLTSLLAYVICRLLALMYEAIVNDPIYFYHQLNLVLWTFVLIADLFAMAVVYSNYQELCDLTRLEDFAKEKARSLTISRSMQDTLNRRSSNSWQSVSARNSQSAASPASLPVSPQTTQSSSSPTQTNTSNTRQTRSGSSLSNQTRASMADFSSLSNSSVEAARKQHLQQLYAQQQQFYAEIRRQREEERHNRPLSTDQTGASSPMSDHRDHTSPPPHHHHRNQGEYLSVSNLPPIQRQGTPLL
jgi:uncharacterized membrane protein YcjF (UPF0283 family)